MNVCAGAAAGIGSAALEPVLRSMGDPLETKTITLSCGKLTTGVTVRPWTGVFMLRNLKSPETYFQTAFRAQSPWTVEGEKGREIVKRTCYVLDFALDRALRQISDYSCRLDVEEKNPERKVAEFSRFLPVIAYDGSSMKRIDAAEILDIALAGTSATLLARRWESALLVNVDNDTLRRLMANERAMAALMRIEGFRALLEVAGFSLLCSLNVFNASLMNDAVYKFKRYEDASLVYTGLEARPEDEPVGLFDTVLPRASYQELAHQSGHD